MSEILFDVKNENYKQDFHLDHRDYLYHVLDDKIDWDSQLLAIKRLILRNIKTSLNDQAEIENNLNDLQLYTGHHWDHYESDHIELMRMAVFHEAAASMATIGMIIPFIERISHYFFARMGDLYTAKNLSPPPDKRWVIPVKDSSSRWNCNLRLTDCGETLDFIGGFRQLALVSTFQKA